MVFDPRDFHYDRFPRFIPVGAMVQFPVAVRTDGKRVVHGIGSAFREWPRMMDLKEGLAVRAFEWRGLAAHLAHTVRLP